ncbi:MAG: hypothetical protein K5866_09400 [Treponema sp.]|nr:hypothetical protein [Treponema sp.]
MKKLSLLLLASLLILGPVYSQVIDSNDNSEMEDDTDWKEQGKKALDETGKFFKKAGNKLKEEINNASEITCYGTWVYQTKGSTSTLICNEDGSMEFKRKIGGETDYWSGTFTATFKVISFSITSAGRKTLITNNKSENPSQTWKFTYSVQDDGNSLRVISSDIPTDFDGTDFSKGVIFTKK